MILALALGCAGPPPVDADARAAYLALVAAPSGDPAVDLARCRGLPDADLAGDCALVAALAADPVACGAIDAGVWRDECWFQAAEIAQRAGDVARAVDRCGRAGRFGPECTYHLWRQAAKVAQDPDPAVALARIRPVEAAWVARLGAEAVWTGETLPGECPDRRVGALFWCVFWTEEMGAVPTPDLAVCDALAVGREGCVIGALTAIKRRAVRARRGCEPGGAGAAYWAPLGVTWVPDPRVDAALTAPCGGAPR